MKTNYHYGILNRTLVKSINYFFTIVIICTTSSLFSQVKYTSAGNFGIGTTSPSSHLHLYETNPSIFLDGTTYSDPIIRFAAYQHNWRGGYIKYDGYSYFTIGVHPDNNTSTSSDIDLLKISRSSGSMQLHYPSTAEYSNSFVTYALNDYTKCYVVRRGSDNFFVYGTGKVWHSGIQQLSDVSLKENITNIENPLELLLQLRPVKYNYIQGAFGGDSYNPEIEFGLIAQEVEKIIPNAVESREDGLKGISYNELTALLIGAIKIQQSRIDALENKLENSESSKKSISYFQDDEGSVTQEAKLFQNIPNPFNDATDLQYYIPQNSNISSLNIYNLNGKMLHSFKISSKGDGKITIPGSLVEAGMYLYNLIVDGKIIDTKQMILTK